MATLEKICLPAGGNTLAYHAKSEGMPDPDEEVRILLHFALSGESALMNFPFCLVADEFIRQGGVAVSFDLPCHGQNVRLGEEGIAGLSARIRRGEDPFREFLADGQAVLDHCSERLGNRRKAFVASGTSRGGYLALRLMAADRRITRAAAFAPVTDWAALDEFGWAKGTERLEAFKLTPQIPALAGRPVFLDINQEDPRVDTNACRQFYQELTAYNQGRDFPTELVEFHLSAGTGHEVSAAVYRRGAAFLGEGGK